MKREIKFRAWDTIEKKFFEPVYEAYQGKLLDLSITLHGELQRRTIELPAEHESMFPDRYVLMQFTGLKDATKWESLTEKERDNWTLQGNMPSAWDGREIYEGDVVEWDEINFDYDEIDNPNVPKRNKKIDKVIFTGCSFKVQCSDFGWEGEDIVYMEDCTIIGNIYENPDLLK